MLPVHCVYPDLKYPGISFSSFPSHSAGIDFTARTKFFFALCFTKYLLSGSMHSCQDFSYFVFSVLLFISGLLFIMCSVFSIFCSHHMTVNGMFNILKVKDFFPPAFCFFKMYLSLIFLLGSKP